MNDEELNDCDVCDQFADEQAEAALSRNSEQLDDINRRWDEHNQQAHPD